MLWRIKRRNFKVWNWVEKYSSRTPHLAGCWESLNKCFQKSVDAVLPYNRFPTDEMLITIFTETECIIKSRPYILELNKPDVLPSSTPYFNAKYMKQQSLFLVNCFWRRFSVLHENPWMVFMAYWKSWECLPRSRYNKTSNESVRNFFKICLAANFYSFF